MQLGAAQVPAEQTALWQSVSTPQVSPIGHAGQLPPQSTSVSLPFFTPSEHDGAWHVPPLHSKPSTVGV
jgi:hypothetical protein